MKKFNLSTVVSMFYDFTDFAFERVKTFNILDWAMLKSCLVSLGILAATDFNKLFKKIKPLITLIFLISWFYTFIKIFTPLFKCDEKKA